MSSDRMIAALGAVLIALAAPLAGGCARTVSETTLIEGAEGAIDDLDYWDRLADVRNVTVNDALHGLLIAADGEAPFPNYEARLAEAHSRGWLSEKSTPPAGLSASVGLVSVAVCDILDIKGGVSMRLFGPNQRNCTRELVYLELIPRRSWNQSLSGLEFIDVLRRVEQRRNPPPPPGEGAGSGNPAPAPAEVPAADAPEPPVEPDVGTPPDKGPPGL